jgi:hypothetical protein
MSSVDVSVKKIAAYLRQAAELAAIRGGGRPEWDNYQATLERAIYEIIKQAQRTE